jgi:predicted PurR-regulated permease PerM
VVFFLIGLYLLFYIKEIVITLFCALIIMSALNPGIKLMERKLKVPRPIGILLSYLVILAVVVLALVVILPPLIAEVPNLMNTLPLPPVLLNMSKFNFSFSELNSLVTEAQTSLGAILGIISSTFQGIFGFFTILVMTAYLLIDRDHLHQKISWFTKEPKHLSLAKELIDRVEVYLGGWVRGQLFLMITIGIVSFIGLSLLSIPYALPLAIAAGFLEILPNLGPTLAAIPSVIVAYGAYGAPMAGFVTIFYIVIQLLENNVIVPKIMKDNVDVNPLTTIVMILTGLKIGGMLGALLAVPIYIVIRTVYSLWKRETAEVAAA